MALITRACARGGGVLAAAALLLVPVAAPTGEPSTTTNDEPSTTTNTASLQPAAATTMTMRQREDHFADRVLALVNRRRAQHHLRQVGINACVRGFSDDWAASLARRNAFEHSDLRRLLSRCSASYVSENIGRIPPTMSPRDLVRLWMQSRAHRHNILSPYPTASGIAVRYDADEGAWLAVQNFARRPGS
jgi:uncharacterized protein YkwD